ncbi:MAG: DUF4350 domain-containing protein [Fuerstiella sp.]
MKKKRRLQRSDLLWLTAVGLLVLLQFWWLPGDSGSPDDTYSNTIEGKLGFFETLQGLSDAGVLPPVRRETEKLIPTEICTLVILGPDLYPNEDEQRELAEFVLNGGSFVFAPNWAEPTCSIPRLSIRTTHGFDGEETTATASGSSNSAGSPVASSPSGSAGNTPSESGASQSPLMAEADDQDSENTTGDSSGASSSSKPGASNSQDQTSPESLNDAVRQAIGKSPGTRPQDSSTVELEDSEDFDDVFNIQTSSDLVDGTVPWRTRATLDTGFTKPVVLVRSALQKVQAAAWNYGNGLVLVSASGDVFSNRAMLDESQAELAVRLIEFAHANHDAAATTPIVVSEFLNNSETYRGTSVLLSPALRSGTLQLLTIAVLAGWFGFHRFGPVKRDTSFERRSLTESASAVGNLFFRTRSGGEAVQSYLEYLKAQLKRSFGSGISIDSFQLIANRTGLEYRDIQQRIEKARNLSGASSTSASQAAGSIRDLAEILERLTGARDATT